LSFVVAFDKVRSKFLTRILHRSIQAFERRFLSDKVNSGIIKLNRFFY
jgi:hypothetical protein